MQTNRKGGQEPQGSANDVDESSGLTTGPSEEEIKLVTSADLESRTDDKKADARAKKGMDNTSEPSSPKEPSRKKETPAGGLRDVLTFFKEVLAEFKKISWPGSKEVVQATWSVLALVAIITLLVLGFDWLLGHAFFSPLEHWARLHGGGIGAGR